ncbi:MAG: hypothetical protein LBF64_06160 [Oscillospiraceae bacterium]|jgi:hypothetical protein|nr:hypothetical protein [Oscillospiraceae bacterium]
MEAETEEEAIELSEENPGTVVYAPVTEEDITWTFVPDRLNEDPENKITDSGGLWTAQVAGFLRAFAYVDSTGGATYAGIDIDGVLVSEDASSNDASIVHFNGAVAPGQTITITATGGSISDIGCYFVPAKIANRKAVE